jgi:hypothetical protein
MKWHIISQETCRGHEFVVSPGFAMIAGVFLCKALEGDEP